MPSYTHAHHCLRQEKNDLVIDCFTLKRYTCINAWLNMVDYLPRTLQGKSHVQVDSCCILFKYSLKHTHRALISTPVLSQKGPGSIFLSK